MYKRQSTKGIGEREEAEEEYVKNNKRQCKLENLSLARYLRELDKESREGKCNNMWKIESERALTSSNWSYMEQG